MRDYVNEHFKRHPDGRLRPVIICADGYKYSVQASSGHYCAPREDNADKYHAVEVWGIKQDGKWHGTEPEGWVSIDAINRRIHRHGGPVYD